MVKNTKTVATLKAQITAKEAVITNYRKKVLQNTLSPEAKSEVDAVIAEKEADLQALRDMLSEAENSPEDKSAELLSKIAEMAGKVEEMQNSIQGLKFKKDVDSFLKTPKALIEFYNAVRKSSNRQEYRENWKKILVENGLTNPNEFLPDAILQSVSDSWETTGKEFFNLLNHTGLKTIKVKFDTNATATARAQGHIKGNVKLEQELTFVTRTIRAQFIYKLEEFDLETVMYEDEGGVLITYVTKELINRLYHEIMRAVLVGDGRTIGVEGKISEVIAIASDTVAYKTDVTYTSAATFTIETVATAVDSIIFDGGDKIAVMSPKTMRALAKNIAATGGTVRYDTPEILAAQLGVSKIFKTTVLKDYDTAVAGDTVVVVFCPNAYKTVGAKTMLSFEEFSITMNAKQYMVELYFGGALSELLSAGVVKRA